MHHGMENSECNRTRGACGTIPFHEQSNEQIILRHTCSGGFDNVQYSQHYRVLNGVLRSYSWTICLAACCFLKRGSVGSQGVGMEGWVHPQPYQPLIVEPYG